ncbi:hypothetical protein B0H11DRAFT_1913044 [Mycena galericulata]|nr:hypothetical protein B0H11DRAFT_1913044 [Mycena galericulata]
MPKFDRNPHSTVTHIPNFRPKNPFKPETECGPTFSDEKEVDSIWDPPRRVLRSGICPMIPAYVGVHEVERAGGKNWWRVRIATFLLNCMLIDVLSTPFDALLPRLRPACRSTRSSLRALNPPLVRTSRGRGLLNAVVINEEYAQDFCAGAANQLALRGTRTLGTPLLNWKISEIKYSTSGCTSMCSRTALTTTTTTQAPGVAVMKASSRRQRWEVWKRLRRSDLLSEFYGGQGLGVGILSSSPLPRINMPRLAAAHYIPSHRYRSDCGKMSTVSIAFSILEVKKAATGESRVLP